MRIPNGLFNLLRRVFTVRRVYTSAAVVTHAVDNVKLLVADATIQVAAKAYVWILGPDPFVRWFLRANGVVLVAGALLSVVHVIVGLVRQEMPSELIEFIGKVYKNWRRKRLAAKRREQAEARLLRKGLVRSQEGRNEER